MHFGKLNILLLVLVISLDFVRSEEDYAPAIPDDADEGVDDDAGVADDTGGDVAAANNDAVADDDAGVADDAGGDVAAANNDAVADDDARVADDAGGDVAAANNDAVADDDAVNNAMTNDPVNGDIIEAENVNPVDPFEDMKDRNPAHTCVPGTHFKIDCNYCFCYKPNIQSCTFIRCVHGDVKLSSNPAKRLAFKKLREHATGCIPGEKVKHQLTNCECTCTIPSVLTCPENCLR
ncbi:uncharacterized protein LOC134797771 [Cydia splendana]|uniref:uncharacterized protein LOC134797771 n=1 Tax=Cydia splendana TaxID=1100963 RepID=UPI0028F492B5